MVEVPYVNVVQTVRTMVQIIQVLPIPKFERLLKFEVDMTQWVRRVQKRNFGSWISLDFVVLVNYLGFK